MNVELLISNIKEGIKNEYAEHIQGFPDSAVSSLRGVYKLIYPSVKSFHTDPAYKAAAILSIISTAGGLITITESKYRCNSGFIDSFGQWYDSENPVAENLKLMADEYINDSYFVDTACMRFKHCESDEIFANFSQYLSSVYYCLSKCKSTDEIRQLQVLTKTIELLANTLPKYDNIPTAEKWDSEKWLEEFLPIWNRRIRQEQHSFRAKYYQKHIAVVQDGCYISQSGKEVQIPWDAYKMMNCSKMYSEELSVEPPTTTFDTAIDVWQMDSLDAAKKLQSETDGITAILNLANRQNPGGGVYSGSGAQEESCFLRSNYFTALYPFADYANEYDLPNSKNQYPLDRNFGGVWSKDVTIFRGRELEGYPLLDEPWKTNFIAVPAINRPATVLNEDGEIRLTPEMTQAALNKIRTIMSIAADNDVTNLVLGAMGCGAFRNPPKHIAELFLQVLNEPNYKGRFNKVVFAITGEELCGVFSKVLK